MGVLRNAIVLMVAMTLLIATARTRFHRPLRLKSPVAAYAPDVASHTDDSRMSSTTPTDILESLSLLVNSVPTTQESYTSPTVSVENDLMNVPSEGQ